jgi:hypothetical protein
VAGVAQIADVDRAVRDFQQKLDTEIKALQRKQAEWDRSRSLATSTNSPNIYSLYINGQHVASFKDNATCTREKNSFQSYIKQTFSQMTNTFSRAGLKGSEFNSIKQQMSKLTNCSCRSERNPNYKPQAIPATPFVANPPVTGETQGNTSPSDKSPPHIFDMPSARNSQQPPTSAKVSLNFEHLETSVGSTGKSFLTSDGKLFSRPGRAFVKIVTCTFTKFCYMAWYWYNL